MKPLTKDEKLILSLIQDFYMNFYKDRSVDEMYSNALKDITRLEIKHIEVENPCNLFETIINLSLERPGLLIGKAGKNIEDLTNFINTKINKPVKIIVYESMINDYLLPYNLINRIGVL